jgi:hypothetical protein
MRGNPQDAIVALCFESQSASHADKKVELPIVSQCLLVAAPYMADFRYLTFGID